MRYNRNVLFTTKYGLDYEGWVKTNLPVQEQFRDNYSWKDLTVYTWTSNFYLLLRIVDSNNNLKYEGYVRTIDDWKKVKKKLNK